MNFGITKGAFIENFIAQEFTVAHNRFYCWAEGTSEIEFLIKINFNIVPVEVKSSKNFRARSLEFYIKRYYPKLAHIISFQQLDLDDSSFSKIPIYCPTLND